MSFGRLERREAPKPMGEINMTPLIDVMLVLLVIFIIAAPLMGSALKLDLPKSDAASPTPGASFIALSITPEGEYVLGDDKLDAKAMRERLAQLAQRQPDAELRLSADQSVPYGKVAQLIGWAQKAGLNRIAFVAENGEPADDAEPAKGAAPPPKR
ncbi:biopolymer transporter ExbD [Roseateles sp.]|uniref:ExbD/TolR family protein n=1 Tax=Roseateles sp. TaxID=1971397 RepID=UPI002F425164